MNNKLFEKLGITPGPWEHDSNVNTVHKKDDRYKDCPDGYAKNQWNDICRINQFFNYVTRQYLSERTTANGRIAASAPELLDALIAFVSTHSHSELTTNNCGCMGCNGRRIIEKATGKTWQEIKAIMEGTDE